jgi:hypothetical protein
MATNTYVALTPSITLTSNTTTVTLSSIPSGYTDLRLVIVPASSSGTNGIRMRINGDTGSNYSITYLSGNGTSASSNRDSSVSQIPLSYFGGITTSLGGTQVAIDFQNYSNTSTYKTALVRYDMASSVAEANVALWRSTSAITSLSFNINSFGSSTGDFITGSTFSLYGIAAASVGAKATGGTIYSDDLYYYHVFGSTGTFTPLSSLSVDALVIAGGGGGGGSASGGYNGGGGGGAGGLLGLTSQSLSATGYTVTVGGGGAGGNPGIGTQGSSSVFNSNTAIGGGYGAAQAANTVGGNGGSGGGASQYGSTSSGGTATSGQGFAGGSSNGQAGGGGGAGAAGTNGVNSTSTYGVGGVGSTTYSTWGLATGFGQNVSGTVYFAGGGGGGKYFDAGAGPLGGLGGGGNGAAKETSSTGTGTANTGGGGGGAGGSAGSNLAGAAGGSGLVIVRYAK